MAVETATYARDFPKKVLIDVMSFASFEDLSCWAGVNRQWWLMAGKLIECMQLDEVEEEDEEEDVEEDDEAPCAVILDIGASSARAGLSLEGDRVSSEPSVVLPSTDLDTIGSEAATDSGEKSRVKSSLSWKKLVTVFRRLVKELDVDLSEFPVLVTQPNVVDAENLTRKIKTLLAREFKVRAAYVAKPHVCAVYSYGFSTGLVVDIGEVCAQVVPICDGYVIESSIRTADHLGGRNLTRQMMLYLRAHNLVSRQSSENLARLARAIKEELAVCASDYAAALKDDSYKRTYHLSHGTKLELHRELLDCGEMLFKPQAMMGDDERSLFGIQDLIKQAVESVDFTLRKELLSTILLVGGTTLMRNFPQRLEIELKATFPHASGRIQVTKGRTDTSRHHAVWSGAAVLSSISDFQDKWEWLDVGNESDDSGDEKKESEEEKKLREEREKKEKEDSLLGIKKQPDDKKPALSARRKWAASFLRHSVKLTDEKLIHEYSVLFDENAIDEPTLLLLSKPDLLELGVRLGDVLRVMQGALDVKEEKLKQAQQAKAAKEREESKMAFLRRAEAKLQQHTEWACKFLQSCAGVDPDRVAALASLLVENSVSEMNVVDLEKGDLVDIGFKLGEALAVIKRTRQLQEEALERARAGGQLSVSQQKELDEAKAATEAAAAGAGDSASSSPAVKDKLMSMRRQAFLQRAQERQAELDRQRREKEEQDAKDRAELQAQERQAAADQRAALQAQTAAADSKEQSSLNPTVKRRTRAPGAKHKKNWKTLKRRYGTIKLAAGVGTGKGGVGMGGLSIAAPARTAPRRPGRSATTFTGGKAGTRSHRTTSSLAGGALAAMGAADKSDTKKNALVPLPEEEATAEAGAGTGTAVDATGGDAGMAALALKAKAEKAKADKMKARRKRLQKNKNKYKTIRMPARMPVRKPTATMEDFSAEAMPMPALPKRRAPRRPSELGRDSRGSSLDQSSAGVMAGRLSAAGAGARAGGTGAGAGAGAAGGTSALPSVGEGEPPKPDSSATAPATGTSTDATRVRGGSTVPHAASSFDAMFAQAMSTTTAVGSDLPSFDDPAGGFDFPGMPATSAPAPAPATPAPPGSAPLAPTTSAPRRPAPTRAAPSRPPPKRPGV